MKRHLSDEVLDCEYIYGCCLCGAAGDYDFGAFADVRGTEYEPSGFIFAQSEDSARYKYACPICIRDEGLPVAPPSEQVRLRKLWWDEGSAGRCCF